MRPPFPVFPQSRRFRGRQFAASLEISRAANRKMKDLCLSGHYTSSIEKLAWGSEHHCGSTIQEARVAGKFSRERWGKTSKNLEWPGHDRATTSGPARPSDLPKRVYPTLFVRTRDPKGFQVILRVYQRPSRMRIARVLSFEWRKRRLQPLRPMASPCRQSTTRGGQESGEQSLRLLVMRRRTARECVPTKNSRACSCPSCK